MRVREVFGTNRPGVVAPGEFFKEGMFGIEIEIETADYCVGDTVYWAHKDDPSLRNDGRELVLREPMGGIMLEGALQELEELYINNPQWSVNDRCSMHCHLDFRDCTVQDVVSFYVLWLLFEAGMYTVSGKDRYTNIYCPGANNCFSLVETVGKIYASTDHREVRRLVHEWPRYTGINLNALEQFGSVEVRTHRGTATAEDVRNWLLLLDCIKRYSTGKAPEVLLQEAKRLGVAGLAGEVFSTMAYKVLAPAAQQYFSINYMNACDVVHYNSIPVQSKTSSVDAMAQQIIDALNA